MNTKNNTLSVEIGRLSVRWTWRVVLKDKNAVSYTHLTLPTIA